MMKIVLTILGALIGACIGAFACMLLLVCAPDAVTRALAPNACAVAMVVALRKMWLIGIPLGAAMFSLIGLRVGYLKDNAAKRRRSEKGDSHLGP